MNNFIEKKENKIIRTLIQNSVLSFSSDFKKLRVSKMWLCPNPKRYCDGCGGGCSFIYNGNMRPGKWPLEMLFRHEAPSELVIQFKNTPYFAWYPETGTENLQFLRLSFCNDTQNEIRLTEKGVELGEKIRKKVKEKLFDYVNKNAVELTKLGFNFEAIHEKLEATMVRRYMNLGF